MRAEKVTMLSEKESIRLFYGLTLYSDRAVKKQPRKVNMLYLFMLTSQIFVMLF